MAVRSKPLRVLLATGGSREAALLLSVAGHLAYETVAITSSRSLRPRQPVDPGTLSSIEDLIRVIPDTVDYLLPADASGLRRGVLGYELDLIIVFGFNWRLPDQVLQLPRLGAINVHPSTLPRYRGPAPILWAIWNGDPYLGVTVHRMDDRFDAGPVLAQRGGIPMPAEPTVDNVWSNAEPVIREVLTEALMLLSEGHAGSPQDDTQASYAGFPPDSWYELTWQQPRELVQKQIRVLRYMERWPSLTTEIRGQPVIIQEASVEPLGSDFPTIMCADGPIWIRAESIESQ